MPANAEELKRILRRADPSDIRSLQEVSRMLTRMGISGGLGGYKNFFEFAHASAPEFYLPFRTEKGAKNRPIHIGMLSKRTNWAHAPHTRGLPSMSVHGNHYVRLCRPREIPVHVFPETILTALMDDTIIEHERLPKYEQVPIQSIEDDSWICRNCSTKEEFVFYSRVYAHLNEERPAYEREDSLP